jgi:hypothetical protein
MPDNDNNQPVNIDARKLALEAMATLVNVKRIAADRLLRPAGIPDALIRQFLKGRDTTTGDALTKRQAGAFRCCFGATHLVGELPRSNGQTTAWPSAPSRAKGEEKG